METLLEKIKTDANGALEFRKDENGISIYHEGGGQISGPAIAHLWEEGLPVAKELKQSIESCLVLGFGAASFLLTLRKLWGEVLVHGIEQDIQMVRAAEKYFDFSNCTVAFTDAYEHCLTAPNKYDLIIFDVYSGPKIPEQFNTDLFVEKLKGLLVPEGVLVINQATEEAGDFVKRFAGKFDTMKEKEVAGNRVIIFQ